MKRGYADTPEGQIHYLTEGNGEPLLLLHRAGLSSDEYTEVIPLLSKRYHVVAMDHLGHGSSDVPSQFCRIEDYAQNAVHFLDAFGINKANVLASHFSTVVAANMAASHPARVNKLVLFDFQYPEPEVQKQRLEFYHHKIMVIKEDGSHLMDLWKYRLSFGHMNLEMCQRDFVNQIRPALGIRSQDGHIALHQYDFRAGIPAMRTRTLLLYTPGARYLRRLEAVKSAISKCQAKIMKGAGYVPTWENPQQFARAVLEFLEN